MSIVATVAHLSYRWAVFHLFCERRPNSDTTVLQVDADYIKKVRHVISCCKYIIQNCSWTCGSLPIGCGSLELGCGSLHVACGRSRETCGSLAPTSSHWI